MKITIQKIMIIIAIIIIIIIDLLVVLYFYLSYIGARGGVVVKALRYKPVGRWFDSRWCHWNFSVT